VEGTSNKFWEVWVEGNYCVAQWGKIGTEGRETVKECKDHAAAQAEMTRLIAEKTKKGYKEKTTPTLSDQHQKPSGIQPRPGALIALPLGSGIEMKLAWIPPGTFLMGSPPGEDGRNDDETQHRVTLTRGFYLGIHPVTQSQWQTVMGNNPSRFKGDSLPVENVSWDDCQEFCQRLGDRTGRRFRLPTEAEWEYACRAGTTPAYHTGDGQEEAKRVGWWSEGKWGSAGQTRPVGQFEPNAWGLRDMHGNVWEWCADLYAPYPNGEVTDPINTSDGDDRVLRGGSWFNGPKYSRSAHRYKRVAHFRLNSIGCRVCLCLD
jgi:formylglycine-generating enzyme required for sulfatase activity